MRRRKATAILTGKVPAEAVHAIVGRITESTIRRFAALEDLTGTICDALDELGIRGCVSASELRPSVAGQRMAGTAITVRSTPQISRPNNTTHVRDVMANLGWD